MKNMKVASLGLALTMVATAMPAMATVTPVDGGHEANVEHAGERPTEAEVCARQTVDANDTAQCTVYAEVGSEFTVTIPKSLTLSGADKKGSYEVTCKGDIAGNQYVSVIPEAQFAMQQTGKADVTTTITQEVIKFRGHNYKEDVSAIADTVLMADKEGNGGEAAEGTIFADGTNNSGKLTAGAWEGTFDFTIALETDSVTPDPAEPTP